MNLFPLLPGVPCSRHDIPGKFLLECLTSLGWMSMNLAFYLLIFNFTPEIGRGSGWSREPFFCFRCHRSSYQRNCANFIYATLSELTEMVRTGGLDSVLVRPLDAQFLLDAI